MKKAGLVIVIICLLGVCFGCGKDLADQSGRDVTGEFDFNQYADQNMTKFLEAYTLSAEDLREEGAGNYLVSKELPFMDIMASYHLICDEEDRILMVIVSFQNEDGLSADFEAIQGLRDYYNGLDDVTYMYDQEEYQGIRNVNSYKTAEELEAAIQQVKEEPQTEREKYFFSLRGIWNGKDGVQAAMRYTFRVEDGISGIELKFCSSDSPLAVSFDHAVPEETSLFPGL